MRLTGSRLIEFKQHIRAMRDRGLTVRQIARLTGKERSTIVYHLHVDFAMLKRANMRRRYEVQKRIRSLQTERGDHESVW